MSIFNGWLMDNMKNKFKLFILKKIYIPMVKSQFRIACMTECLAHKLVQLMLRDFVDNFQLPGFDLEVDGAISHVVSKELDFPMYDDEAQRSFDGGVDQQVRDAFDSDDVRQIKCKCFLLRAFRAHLLRDSENERSQLECARKICPDVELPQFKDIAGWRKNFKEWHLAFKRELENKYALKLDLSLRDVAIIISMISSILLIGGYVYERIYLGVGFGVNIANYFSIGDYLSSAMDQLTFAMMNAAAFIVGMGLARYDNSVSKPKSSKWVVTFGRCVYRLLLWGGPAFAIWLYFIRPDLLTGASFVLLISFGVLSNNLARKYFRKHVAASFIITFISLFLVSVIIAAKVDSVKALTLPRNHGAQPVIHLKKAIKLDTSKMELLSSNSRYYFMYDRSRKRAVVIPKREVLYID